MNHFNQIGVWIENCWTKVQPIKKIAEHETAHVVESPIHLQGQNALGLFRDGPDRTQLKIPKNSSQN
jgi:hypothetical protein